MAAKSAEPKSRSGSGGPRTVQGKSKSSQNSSKHDIFVPRVLPDEENDAALLFEEIQKEFHLKGAMELKIGRDLVQNEVEARRIERFAIQQFIRAEKLGDLDGAEQMELRHLPLNRLPIPKEKEGHEGYRTRLRPSVCVQFLTGLKKRIEKHGLQPDEDLKILDSIYGDQMTMGGEVIVSFYRITATNSIDAGDKRSPSEKKISDQDFVLAALEVEIKSQNVYIRMAAVREEVECASSLVVLPPDPDLDKIEKYRTANARKFTRSLENLKTIRSLKGRA